MRVFSGITLLTLETLLVGSITNEFEYIFVTLSNYYFSSIVSVCRTCACDI